MISSGPLNRRVLLFSSKRRGNWDSERVSVTPRLHKKWQARDLYWGLASSLGSFLPPSDMSVGPGSNNQTLCLAVLPMYLTLGFLSDLLSPKGALAAGEGGKGCESVRSGC